MNADIRDLPAMLQQTLRTGIIPPAAQIAAATGKSIDEVGRALAEKSPDSDAEPAHAGPQESQRHRDLVAAAVDEWYEDNPGALRGIPADVRAHIEESCRRQISYEEGTAGRVGDHAIRPGCHG
ncbi:hypothetical protein BHQ15_00540 [Mycolicibacillus koreensis]|nr:hypothetical protein BHQ15_00540 [Mycolicibacillus koreensis]